MENQIRVGILLFNEVEVLDFAGPFEVFSITTTESGEKAFTIKTVSETGELIHARNGLKVKPDYSFKNAPAGGISAGINMSFYLIKKLLYQVICAGDAG